MIKLICLCAVSALVGAVITVIGYELPDLIERIRNKNNDARTVTHFIDTDNNIIPVNKLKSMYIGNTKVWDREDMKNAKSE